MLMDSIVKAVFRITGSQEEEANEWYKTFHFQRHLDLLNSPNDINGIVFKFNQDFKILFGRLYISDRVIETVRN